MQSSLQKIFAIFLLMGLAIAPAAGQLTIVSSSINNGDTLVALDATLRLEFSEPLDTAAVFSGSPNFPYLRFSMVSDHRAYRDSIDLALGDISEDLTVVEVPLYLVENGQYLFQLRRAISDSGAVLTEPYRIRFSTGHHINDGRISGRVSNGDDFVANARMFAIPRRLMDEEAFHHPYRYGVATARTDSAGFYRLNFLPTGSYFVLAFQDVDGDESFSVRAGDAIGSFKNPETGLPRPVGIGVDQERGRVDVAVNSWNSESTDAQTSKQAANILARKWAPDAKMFSLAAVDTVTQSGESHAWLYLFSSRHSHERLLLLYTGDNLVYSHKFEGHEPLNVHPLPIPTDWVSSATAMGSAETAVGQDLRAQYDHVRARMILLPELREDIFLNRAVWVVRYNGYTSGAGKTALPPADRVHRTVLVDAHSGEVVTFDNRTAEEAVALVDSIAIDWADDALLVNVNSLLPADTNGTSKAWEITYYSRFKRAVARALVSGPPPFRTTAFRDSVKVRRGAIEDDWIDSPAALDSSARFASFSDNNEDVQVLANLHAVVYNLPADTTVVWKLLFSGFNPETGRRRFGQDLIDAYTGEHVTPQTYLAFENLDLADSLATAWSDDAELVRLTSSRHNSVDTTGSSRTWFYSYYSAGSESFFDVFVAGRHYRARERNGLSATRAPLAMHGDSVAVYLDSDEAMAAARAFLTEHGRDDARLNRVSMTLGRHKIGTDSTITAWTIGIHGLLRRMIVVDAYTGEVRVRPIRSGDKEAFQVAQATAKEWQPDAVARYAKADSVDAEGTVARWMFGFSSVTASTNYMIEVEGGVAVDEYETDNLPQRFGRRGALRNWKASEDAMARAENAFGAAGRLAGNIARVVAELTSGDEETSAGKQPGEDGVWVVTYYDQEDNVTTVTIDGDETVVTSGEDEGEFERPVRFALDQNYPNPFNPTTTIGYTLPASSKVKIEVYNVLGQRIAVLLDGIQTPNAYQVSWNAAGYASGLYFYRIEATSITNAADRFVQVRKMMLVK